MAKTNRGISVVVPVFNESAIINQFHKKLIDILQGLPVVGEIIYIDDNSTDGTYEYLTAQINQTNKRRTNSTVRKRVISPKKGNIKISVSVLQNIGKKGKASSKVKGLDAALGDTIVILDHAFQLSLDDLPKVLTLCEATDVVVVNRNVNKNQFVQKIIRLTSKLFLGLDVDAQSGIICFKKLVYQQIRFIPLFEQIFTFEFLYRAKRHGFSITGVQVAFNNSEQKKVYSGILQSTASRLMRIIKAKLKIRIPIQIPPVHAQTMQDAGVIDGNSTYITHSTLSPLHCAVRTFTLSQKFLFSALLAVFFLCLLVSPLRTIQGFVGVLSLLYFFDLLFNLILVLRSLDNSNEIIISQKQIQNITDSQLPVYTILCPLYKEAHVMPQFLDAISALDYPKDKLDVLILLESDDLSTIDAVSSFSLPSYIRTLIVPDSLPRTKPKACNYGLNFAKGELLVIYDAEDKPEPDQLKKAYLSFTQQPENVACLQAKLSYYNTEQNILTKFFTAEYSLWFDLTLTGLQGISTSIPLGGTSNHFRTETLRKLYGWDAFNVTEDADLGIRLFTNGYKTAIIDSTTYEEATSMVSNWLRQRSRWIKGYMQTYLVHMRTPVKNIKKTGFFHHVVFEFTVGGKILFMFLNPVMWIVTFSYFALHPFVSRAIESAYIAPISYFGVVSAIFGNFLFFFCYMIACAKKGQWTLIKYTFLIPFYWILMSIAGYIAFYQLLFKPFYWEKTEHGLHLPTEEEISKPVLPFPGRGFGPVIIPVFTRGLQAARMYGSSSFRQMDFVYIGEKAGTSIAVTAPYIPDANEAFPKRLITQDSLFSTFMLLIYRTGIKAARGLSMFFIHIAILTIKAYHTIELVVSPGAGVGHVIYQKVRSNFVKVIKNNIQSIAELFHLQTHSVHAWRERRLRILIFNWRDVKHVYSGGAEVYVHQLAKRWVQDGNSVTLFCGNDNQHPSNDKVDGVSIIRRGGTYTVYFFAVAYYLLKFRGKYDLIIDCENGIPFFTPFFIRKPIILVIHHVHQDVFRAFLQFPFKQIASFLEGKLMPFVYQNKSIITVSESSRQDILSLGFTKAENIEIIHNGVNFDPSLIYPKTKEPSFVYLGRLKAYKNVDIAIHAFAKVVKEQRNATLTIAGYGEMQEALEQLVGLLGIRDNVRFLGFVTEAKKAQLLSQSWALIQPSSMEGWGITVIEANAKGTPVIASKVPGLRDSVVDEHTGILVNPKDVAGFARAMMKIIDDPDFLTILSYNASEWARNFAWDKSANSFYAIIGRSFGEINKEKSFAELLATVNK